MTSKAKFGFKGLATVTDRNVQRAKAKLGKVEETVDIGFNQERLKFEAQYKIMKKLSKDMHDFSKMMRAISDAHRDIGQSINQFYDSGSPLYELNNRYQGACIDIDRARQDLDETLRIDITDPVDIYLVQYKQVEKRIVERDRRRVDMDRFRAKVRKHQQKPTQDPKVQAKMEKAELEYARNKVAYEELNAELMHDIGKLLADKVNFFDPCFVTIILAQSRYYSELQGITQNLVNMVPPHINPKSAHDHPHVITLDEASTANKAYELGKYQSTSPQDFKPAYAAPSSYGSQGPYTPPGSTYGSQQPPVQHHQPYQSAGGYAPPQSGGYPPQGLQPPAHGHGHGPAPGGAPRTLPPRPMPAVPQPPKRDQARGLYPFQAETPQELSFNPGDVLNILAKNGDWWEAELNGRKGLIPANYVQMC